MVENSISVSEVAKLLGVSRDRIEQSISRGVFLPQVFSDPGKAREWTFGEVIRLAVFFRLTDSGRGMDAKTAGYLTQLGVHGFKDGPAFFVAYTGNPRVFMGNWQPRICRLDDVTQLLTEGCEYPKVLASGNDPETLKRNSEKLIGPVYACVVLNLDQIEAEIEGNWPTKGEA